jgi:hypothetical protein
MARHGLAPLRALEPVALVQRYEYARPGELLHLDVSNSVASAGSGIGSPAIAALGARDRLGVRPRGRQ